MPKTCRIQSLTVKTEVLYLIVTESLKTGEPITYRVLLKVTSTHLNACSTASRSCAMPELFSIT